jgi:putative transposase
MARRARILVPGLPHHVTHRGNRRGTVFFSDADRHDYLARLVRAGGHHGLELWAYCLMTNHVHLVVLPRTGDALARTIREVHGQHARSLHRRFGWDGHLWSNRYFSSALAPDHLWAAVRYVERNPVRAGLASAAEEFAWSSARTHCGLAPLGPLSTGRPFPGPIPDWRAWLAGDPDESAERAIRTCTATGRPAGSREFVTELEQRLGRPIGPFPRGRRRKSGTGT